MADSGKLLATPGVSQVEGSAGGGIVPWAQLAGYASDEQWSLGGFCSRASVDTEAGIAHTTQNQILARLAPLRGEVIKI
ncbi:hypothetical protein AT705_14330 [Pseudoalteromonas rubra]|uniref:Uncharacterized protein n=1 Tax=Pseudoalteromonas rubra TaxID=43658 RepID=A0A0U3I7L2_9GAMM|nr:hypothetical protein AT705_14330 [Pseudoalteromonas rubra]